MKTVLLASAAIFALTAGASAATHPSSVTHAQPHHYVHGLAPGLSTLYDQNVGDNGVGIVSSDFDSGSFDSYDSQIADDFSVPSGSSWSIKEIDVTGVYFNGYGPADGVNVYLYKNKKGAPGDTVAECDNLSPAQDNAGSFVIKIPKTCKIHAKGGNTYWVSVQARMNFVGGAGEWGWTTNNTQNGKPAMFRSAGGFGCTNWDTLANCIGSYGQGPDVAFALLGKSK